ncbi:MAG: pilus assembly protein PilM [Candidatus Paceibacterota bacterium]
MSSQKFFKRFPVPYCMNVDGVGVDLSEVSLRFIKLAPKREGFELRDFGEYPIPEGTISLGQIKKPDVLKEILSRFRTEHAIRFVHSSLPESLAYPAEMDIPAVKNSELYESLELQLEEYVPISVADAAFDYNVIGSNKNKQGTITVVASVVPKEIVVSYADVFASAGITLLSLETDSSALARAVIPDGSTETSMILDLGRIKTGVYVVSHGVVFFVSDIDIGEKDIAAALSKELNITSAEAKEMISKLHANEEPSEEAYAAISSVFGDLKEEVNRHFIYWHSFRDKNGVKREPIGRIILCGSGSSLFGLEEYLMAELRTPIDIANVWGNVFSFEKDIPKIPFQDSLLYSTAIGLSLYSKAF